MNEMAPVICPFCGSNKTSVIVNPSEAKNIESEDWTGTINYVYGCSMCGQRFSIEPNMLEKPQPVNNPKGENIGEQETLPKN